MIEIKGFKVPEKKVAYEHYDDFGFYLIEPYLVSFLCFLARQWRIYLTMLIVYFLGMSYFATFHEEAFLKFLDAYTDFLGEMIRIFQHIDLKLKSF